MDSVGVGAARRHLSARHSAVLGVCAPHRDCPAVGTTICTRADGNLEATGVHLGEYPSPNLRVHRNYKDTQHSLHRGVRKPWGA